MIIPSEDGVYAACSTVARNTASLLIKAASSPLSEVERRYLSSSIAMIDAMYIGAGAAPPPDHKLSRAWIRASSDVPDVLYSLAVRASSRSDEVFDRTKVHNRITETRACLVGLADSTPVDPTILARKDALFTFIYEHL